MSQGESISILDIAKDIAYFQARIKSLQAENTSLKSLVREAMGYIDPWSVDKDDWESFAKKAKALIG